MPHKTAAKSWRLLDLGSKEASSWKWNEYTLMLVSETDDMTTTQQTFLCFLFYVWINTLYSSLPLFLA
jgi:hypothetical protein